MKLLLMLLFLGIPSNSWPLTAEDFGIELQNKVTAQALTTIQSLPDGRLEYEYALQNSTMSVQAIINLIIEVPVKISTANMIAAPGWGVGGCCWSVKGRKFATWLSGLNDPFVVPGASLRGFRLVLKSIPAIKEFRVQGFSTRDIAQGEGTEEENEILGEIQSLENNSAAGPTVGPDLIPDVVDPTAFIDRLISLKHQSLSLGWIFGPGADGIVKSLDAKLEAAKAALGRGQNKAASSQLKAFINELTALRGKKMNDNAFYLLKVNAEFIVSKLAS